MVKSTHGVNFELDASINVTYIIFKTITDVEWL